ncbi:uroporphyrinogen-III synthase-like [Actinia tenebrosa]|uniref:Uroporphyrinogen-III synthase n=1 Tax=Actinia tenebrosa TaxID=6105 RepID=A0A6P8HLC0_ACTTE|nr:uroporphyrinogen-III synthase-like [Actinia tenebrosa]
MAAVCVVLLRAPSASEKDKYHRELMSKGYVPYSIPVLSFEFENLDRLAETLHQPQSHGGMIITSPRSVEAIELSISKYIPKEKWLEVLQKQWQDLHLFAIGDATSTAMKNKLGLQSCGYQSGSAEKLVPIIKQVITAGNQPLLFPCGNLRRETIPQEMKNAGIKLTSVEVYKTIPNPEIQSALQEHIKTKGLPDVIVFFSPSGLEFTIDFIKDIMGDLSTIKLVAIGNTTSQALHNKGLSVAGVAEKPNPESLCQCIQKCCPTSG